VIHDIPLERRTLHGHFSRELPPVATVDPGDTVRFSTLDAGWHVEPVGLDHDGAKLEPRDEELDSGHALIGPIAVRGARAGRTLSVRIDALEPGPYGLTLAGGWETALNTRLGVDEGETAKLVWSLVDGVGTDQHGRRVRLAPFLGVLGMPPDEPGVHSTTPPRACGGNLDCKELVAGSTLYLPIPVDGALFSAGDGHARQGDGEVSTLAIEAPFDRVELTLGVRDDLPLELPLAETPAGWVAIGIHADLHEAAALAIEGIVAVLQRELGVGHREALALASVVVDVHVTQLVNEVVGCHAVLPRNAFL